MHEVILLIWGDKLECVAVDKTNPALKTSLFGQLNACLNPGVAVFVDVKPVHDSLAHQAHFLLPGSSADGDAFAEREAGGGARAHQLHQSL